MSKEKCKHHRKVTPKPFSLTSAEDGCLRTGGYCLEICKHFKIQPKAHPSTRRDMLKAAHNGNVCRHQACPMNPLGQTSLSTVIDDLQDIIESVGIDDPALLNRMLSCYFLEIETLEEYWAATPKEKGND